MSSVVRQGLLIAMLSLLLAVGAVALARLRLLTLRYTLGWLALSIVGVGAALLTGLVDGVARSLGITPTAMFALGGTGILLLIAVQLSISVSGLQGQTQRLAEANALLSHRVLGGSVTRSDGGVAVIVPAYNEAATVGFVVRSLIDAGLVVVVVDDGSADATGTIAYEAGAHVLSLPFNLGVGGALRCGFRWAVDHGFEAVVQCDADGQHRVDQVKVLLDARERTGAHLVVGSRFAHEPSWDVTRSRRMLMRVLARLASTAACTRITDSTSGFRCIGQPLLGVFARNYPAQYLGDTFEALVAAGRAGYTIVEVPAELERRQAGRSSASTAAALRYILRAITVTVFRIEVRVPRPKAVARAE